ncbi:MAG: saccharopine dehydrogenase NADP-binding domain-containing protein [Candidatus Roizmanbacteria bacterium]
MASRKLPQEITFTVADYDLGKARTAIGALDRFTPVQVNAEDPNALHDLFAATRPEIVVDLLHPRFAPAVASAAVDAKSHYINTAQSESGDGQLLGAQMRELNGQFQEKECVGIVGMGADPGISELLAREVLHGFHDDEQSVRQVTIFDGSTSKWLSGTRRPTMAGFSYSVFVDECTKSGLVWSAERGITQLKPLTLGVPFPYGGTIGSQTGIHAEHEEIGDIAHAVSQEPWMRDVLKKCEEVSFQYGMSFEQYLLLTKIMKAKLHTNEPVKLHSVPRTNAAYVRAVTREMGTADVLNEPTTRELFTKYGLTASKNNLTIVPQTPLEFFTRLQPPPHPKERMSAESRIGPYIRTNDVAVYRSHHMTEDDAQTRYGRSLVAVQTAAGPIVATRMILDGVWKEPGVRAPIELPYSDAITAWGDVAGKCETENMTEQMRGHRNIYRCWDPSRS